MDKEKVEIVLIYTDSSSETIEVWNNYNINLSLANDSSNFVLEIHPDYYNRVKNGNTKIKILLNGAEILNGILDEINQTVSTEGRTLKISGRDYSGILMDSTSPRYNMNNKTLKLLAEDLISPWVPDFIKGVVTDNAPSVYKVASSYRIINKSSYYKGVLTTETGEVEYIPLTPEEIDKVGELSFEELKKRGIIKFPDKKVKKRTGGGVSSPYYRGFDRDSRQTIYIESGEKIWETISNFSKDVACCPFLTTDGKLFIGRTNYLLDIYDNSLIINKDNMSAEIINVDLSIATGDRYSHYKCTTQGRKTTRSKGNFINQGITVIDPSDSFHTYAGGKVDSKLYKPFIIAHKNFGGDEKLLRRYARTVFEENIINSFKYTIELYGHYFGDTLFLPDTNITVVDNINGFSDRMYIRRVSFMKDKNDGTKTIIDLIPARIWLGLDHDTIEDKAYFEFMREKIWW